MEPFALGVLVTALSFAACGAALLLRGTARVSAVLCILAGATGVLAAVSLGADHERLGDTALVAASALLVPLALATYPSLRWRHPVDFVALVALAGCGLAATLWVAHDVAAALAFGQGCLLLAYGWWRVEVARDRERRALVWLSLAVVGTGFLYFLTVFSFSNATSATVPASAVAVFGLVPPTMYVGATQPDLVDVRGLVVRVVVFSVAVVFCMGVFVLVIAVLDEMGVPEANLGALATVAGLTGALFHPTQVVLRGVVDQLLFGERPDPLGAASTVAGRIGEDPMVALRAIREALVVPYAALLVDGVPLAASGTESTHTRTLDLDGAGELVVGLRPGDLSFSAGDEQVLRLTVPLLAQTLRARALADALIESRGQTIAAVAEERRRLRRELHDGLGPRLSGVAFTSDAARNLIRSDPEAAERMVAQLRADTVTAIEEIRRMVYAMRPPALDELGLVPALRQQAVGLRNRAGEPVAVDVTAPEELPDLPAAVEVAAYRIVTEALTNVARHSTSGSASVRIEPAPDGLHLEVTDRGASGAWRAGVGLASMRERAAELGGTLEAGPGPSGGRVSALLPL
jgi:two-component system NarL family sensor kinase